jgi:photoactive yellow protein
MTDHPTFFANAATEPALSISGASVDALDDGDLDRAPFGIICLDSEGTILRYNLYESTLARLDRNDVLGRHFFEEVARCTRGPGFEGRFRRFVAGSDAIDDQRFEYDFDFAFGAQRVTVELHRFDAQGRYYLFVNRRAVGPVRPQADEIAVLQRALAPDEGELGVRRDDNERRFVEVPQTFFLALRSTFARLAPEAWPLFAAEWGVQWGRRAVIELEADSLEACNASLEDLAMSAAAKRVGDYLRERGWGNVRFDFSPAREGLIGLVVERSVLSSGATTRATLSDVTAREGSCAMLAGFFTGAFGHLAARKVSAREVCCRSRGAPQCEFVLVGGERASALDRVVASGASSIESARAALRKPTRGTT